MSIRCDILDEWILIQVTKFSQRHLSQHLNITLPERLAESSAFSYLLQKKASVSPRTQVSSSEAASSTL
jgi:hypothetical protein